MSRIRRTPDPPPEKCQGNVQTFLGWCDRQPTVERGGKRYCWQHDPERVSVERRDRAAQRREEARTHEANIQARWRRDELLRKSGVGALTDQDLEQIVTAGGIWAFLPWRPGESGDDVND